MLGDAVARWWAMRRLSLSVARMIDSGEAPAVQSALVKEMATRFEQDLLACVQELVALEPDARRGLAVRAAAVRGGAERPLVHDPRRHERDPALGRVEGAERAVSDWLLIDGARRLLADTCTYEAVQAAEADGWSSTVWDAVAGAGYGSISELALADALAVLTVAGEHAAPVPLAEAALAGWLLDEPLPGRRASPSPANCASTTAG